MAWIDSQVLAGNHSESNTSGYDNHPYRLQRSSALEMVAAKDREPALGNHADDPDTHCHEWGEPVYRREWVAQPHGFPVHDEFGQRPSETGKSGCREDHDEAGHRDRCGVEHHEEHPERDEQDDGEQAVRVLFDVEEKGEEEDKEQRGRLCHGWREDINEEREEGTHCRATE